MALAASAAHHVLPVANPEAAEDVLLRRRRGIETCRPPLGGGAGPSAKAGSMMRVLVLVWIFRDADAFTDWDLIPFLNAMNVVGS